MQVKVLGRGEGKTQGRGRRLHVRRQDAVVRRGALRRGRQRPRRVAHQLSARVHY